MLKRHAFSPGKLVVVVIYYPQFRMGRIGHAKQNEEIYFKRKKKVT